MPTRLGIVLVQGYLRIDPDLVLPRIRANIETACNLIASGQAGCKSVVAHSLRNFERKFAFFCSHISRMDDLFASSFHSLSPAQAAAQRFTRCGLTRQYLQYIRGPPARLYNAATEQLYALPSGGSLRQFSGRLCDREGCAFELSLYVVGSHPQRCYPFCPYCYNNPVGSEDEVVGVVTEEKSKGGEGAAAAAAAAAAETTLDTAAAATAAAAAAAATAAAALSVAGGSACLECPLPDTHPTVQSMRVCDDPESGGCFILDPSGGPKWRLISTRSAFCVHFPKKRIKSVVVLAKKDAATGCHWIRLEFREGQAPPEVVSKAAKTTGNRLTYSGCLLTDPFLHQFLHSQEGSNARKRVGGGRGRGGGRRGGKRKGGGR
jgi:DNA topoisomerase-3